MDVRRLRCLRRHGPAGHAGSNLKPNHYAATVDGFVDRDGEVAYSLLEAGGCSAPQFVESAGLGAGHLKHGLSRGELESWIASLTS